MFHIPVSVLFLLPRLHLSNIHGASLWTSDYWKFWGHSIEHMKVPARVGLTLEVETDPQRNK